MKPIALCALALVSACAEKVHPPNRVSIEVPVSVIGEKMRFLQSAKSCHFKVVEGEEWKYLKEPYRIVIETPEGKSILLHEYSYGVWGARAHGITLENNKFVLNQDCEGRKTIAL